jgi:hypothetical protein
VTDEGEKTKLPPGPTVTPNVVAFAILGHKINEVVAITTSVRRQEKILIVVLFGKIQRI